MKVIECNNLTKRYTGKNVLNEMSFSIEENTITGLIGRNGVGKTTLLKIIAGFIKETSGEIRIFGEKPFNSLNVSVNSIFVDDAMSIPPALQLKDVLDAAGKFYPNWNATLANRLFDYFSFEPWQYHNRLSKGKTSTFNAIIGLAARCPLTIFDEPTTGMDEAAQRDFYRALLKDYIAHPRTVILSSHHIEEMEDILEDILLLKGGKAFLHLPMTELTKWGIGIKGATDSVLGLIEKHKVIHQRTVGSHSLYAVIKNDLTLQEQQEAYLAGIELTPVHTSDLFIYLTNETKGGIDDVFINNESD
jgi:ABC-2 type transport system ATP-binding protein